jgi:hypothetical protein
LKQSITSCPIYLPAATADGGVEPRLFGARLGEGVDRPDRRLVLAYDGGLSCR